MYGAYDDVVSETTQRGEFILMNWYMLSHPFLRAPIILYSLHGKLLSPCMKKDYDEERNQAIWLRSIVLPSGGASDGFESSAVNRMRKRGVLLGNTAVYDMTYEAKS